MLNPPPTYTTVRFYAAIRQNPDGDDAAPGELRLTNGRLVGAGLGEGAIRGARARLWDDDAILRFCGAWANGYAYSRAVGQ